MGTSGALMAVSALALLVTAVSYDPTPLRVLVTTLCCRLDDFFLGHR